MLVRAALIMARERLQVAGLPAAGREAQLVCAYLCGVEPGQLALNLEQGVDEARLNTLLARRVAGEPLQYVLGEAGFMGLAFAVGPGVLIPRADTEVLVERAIALLIRGQKPENRGQNRAFAGAAVPGRLPAESAVDSNTLIADIGTGCGAIALSLAHYLPQAIVHGVDISPAALCWADKNVQALGLAQRCHFYEGDLLAPLAAQNLRFDLIISNPPYVTEQEMADLPPEVKQEPTQALNGGPDGLNFYRRLAKEAPPLLKPSGHLLLEHGWQQQEQVAALLQQAGWQVEERLRDYGGRGRGVLGMLAHQTT